MYVCANCILAIESREGQQKKAKYFFEIDSENTPVNKCEWCHEEFSENEEVIGMV